jgi:hypothetical protein
MLGGHILTLPGIANTGISLSYLCLSCDFKVFFYR